MKVLFTRLLRECVKKVKSVHLVLLLRGTFSRGVLLRLFCLPYVGRYQASMVELICENS